MHHAIWIRNSFLCFFLSFLLIVPFHSYIANLNHNSPTSFLLSVLYLLLYSLFHPSSSIIILSCEYEAHSSCHSHSSLSLTTLNFYTIHSNPHPNTHFQKYLGSLCHVNSYKAPNIPHTQLFTREEIAMCVFFLFTSPIWFLSIFSVRMAKIMTGKTV